MTDEKIEKLLAILGQTVASVLADARLEIFCFTPDAHRTSRTFSAGTGFENRSPARRQIANSDGVNQCGPRAALLEPPREGWTSVTTDHLGWKKIAREMGIGVSTVLRVGREGERRGSVINAESAPRSAVISVNA